jgi:hypothetical protein
MGNLPSALLNYAIEKILTRLQSRGIDIAPIKEQIIEQLENKILETFLAMMSPEQLDQYEKALNTEDTEKIQLASAEIASAIPEFGPTLDQVIELEYEHIAQELTQN